MIRYRIIRKMEGGEEMKPEERMPGEIESTEMGTGEIKPKAMGPEARVSGKKTEFAETFAESSKAYGGMPFWAWNCHVESDVARRQIGYFDEMGMGGFVIHSRTGLGLPYLGPEFMERVRECVKEAADRGMKVWLYDEDRWPSGFAGGLVTRQGKYRAMYLVFTPVEGGREPADSRHRKDGRLDLLPHGGGRLLGVYAITFQNGNMRAYRQGEAECEREETWYLYEEEMEEQAWFNNQTYMDTLNGEAVNRFLEITYEAYERELGDAFGNEAAAIFTDEPQFVHKRFPEYEGSKEPVVLPYTSGMEEELERDYGVSLLARLPELVWDTGDDRSGEMRYYFHRFVGERFAKTYCDRLGMWCREHGIALTGHMKGEDKLQSQAASLGEAMRGYCHFQIPGVDILCDRRLYTTVKQAQSASRQLGRNQVASEEYGVTNWDFDFVGHKLQGDWQAALGVTNRVHHLAWMSMEGEAKRDFPASIFYQSPWYREYATLEQYFGRIRMAMEMGKAVVSIGVIHPIESYWMIYGGTDHEKERKRLEKHFQELTEWLLFGKLDFDFISESLLEQLPREKDGLRFGEMTYRVILVPELLTLRSSTLERLQKFEEDGGSVWFLGGIPEFMDGRRSEEPEKLAEQLFFLQMERDRLLQVLEPQREVDILDADGKRNGDLLYQLREKEQERWLFVANGRKPPNRDEPKSREWDIMVKGEFRAEIWDAMDGTIMSVETGTAWRKDQVWTVLKARKTDQDSLLIRLEESQERSEGQSWENSQEQSQENSQEQSQEQHQEQHQEQFRDKTQRANPPKKAIDEDLEFIQCLTVDSCMLQEPNVLLLDQAEYQLDEEDWQPREEVLRIENKIRTRLGYALKQEAYAQPWAARVLPASSEAILHTVTLRFQITAQTSIKSPFLAVERPEEKSFFWNKIPIQAKDLGYYVDESIRRIRLPDIPAGSHQLLVQTPFCQETNLEWLYLLGDFGVRTGAAGSCLIPILRNPGFGSLTERGLPFYGGNVTYQFKIEAEEGEYELEVPKFRAPLLAVQVDGTRRGILAFAPYRLKLGHLSGRHDIEIISFGSRINTFGPVHNCDQETDWFGPGAWRTTGEKYSDAYQLKETGILEAPRLYRRRSKVV